MIEPLTEREHGLLLMLADGMRYSDIAEEWEYTKETITVYRKSLFLKLGAKTAAHAVAIAYHKHILKIPGLVY